MVGLLPWILDCPGARCAEQLPAGAGARARAVPLKDAQERQGPFGKLAGQL